MTEMSNAKLYSDSVYWIYSIWTKLIGMKKKITKKNSFNRSICVFYITILTIILDFFSGNVRQTNTNLLTLYEMKRIGPIFRSRTVYINKYIYFMDYYLLIQSMST